MYVNMYMIWIAGNIINKHTRWMMRRKKGTFYSVNAMKVNTRIIIIIFNLFTVEIFSLFFWLMFTTRFFLLSFWNICFLIIKIFFLLFSLFVYLIWKRYRNLLPETFSFHRAIIRMEIMSLHTNTVNWIPYPK